ncbi:MAG: HTTM domain-containing protein [Chryseolinea sp.]
MPVKHWIEKFEASLTSTRRQPLASKIFFKSIVCYALVKVILIWNVSNVMLQYHNISLPRSLVGKIALAPAFLTNIHPNLFQSVVGALLLVILIVGPNYIANVAFCWLALNLAVVYHPLGNGADLILLMLSVWCIPLDSKDYFSSSKLGTVQVASFNVARLLLQWQIIFVYMSSGLDKILSEAWRSGQAFQFIRHFQGLYNPTFPSVFQTPFWDFVLAWVTIIFELSFGALVWNRFARKKVLTIGLVFHIVIWWMLSLPDFAMIMALSLLIFLEDADYYLLVGGKRVGSYEL